MILIKHPVYLYLQTIFYEQLVLNFIFAYVLTYCYLKFFIFSIIHYLSFILVKKVLQLKKYFQKVLLNNQNHVFFLKLNLSFFNEQLMNNFFSFLLKHCDLSLKVKLEYVKAPYFFVQQKHILVQLISVIFSY